MTSLTTSGHEPHRTGSSGNSAEHCVTVWRVDIDLTQSLMPQRNGKGLVKKKIGDNPWCRAVRQAGTRTDVPNKSRLFELPPSTGFLRVSCNCAFSACRGRHRESDYARKANTSRSPSVWCHAGFHHKYLLSARLKYQSTLFFKKGRLP